MRALLSMYDKTHLGAFAKTLTSCGFELVASGGTADALERLGFGVREVEDFTGYPSILGGRVKTLHPCVHGGILAKSHEDPDLKEWGIQPFDLVACSLYPFQECVADPERSEADHVEMIDIGGPTLLRAAAKNFGRVLVVSGDYGDPDLHARLATGWDVDGGVDAAFRKAMAAKAFRHVLSYDAAIASYFDDTLHVALGTKVHGLKYGMNPSTSDAVNGKAAIVRKEGFASCIQVLHGRPSYINLLDGALAWDCVHKAALASPGSYAAASFKHNSPAGVACSTLSLADAYRKARACDPLSSYGDFVGLSAPLDMETARLIKACVCDGVIVPPGDDHDEALALLKTKKGGAFVILQAPCSTTDFDNDVLARDVGFGTTLVQQSMPHTKPLSPSMVVANGKHGSAEHAFAAIEHEARLGIASLLSTQSNSVCVVFGGQVIATGAGQQNRVDCVRMAIAKAHDWFLLRHLHSHHDPEFPSSFAASYINPAYDKVRAMSQAQRQEALTALLECVKTPLVLVSDGFFPFDDSVHLAAKGGINAIVQPGGSLRDESVIDAAKAHDLVLVHTGDRYFTH